MYFSKQIHIFLQTIVDFLFDRITELLCILWWLVKPIFVVFFNKVAIKIDGNNAWDIKVKDNRFYGLLAAKGMTGLVDAFVEGYFDCDDLEATFMKLILGSRTLYGLETYHPYRLLKYFIHTYFDALTPESTTSEHYDNDISNVKNLSDSTAQYSAMLLYDFDEIENANVEQIQQLLDEGTFRARENIAKKLKLEPGMKVLDIGCGFGGLAKHLAERYKVEVTGVSISNDMAEYASEVCKGLPVKILHIDYRAVKGKFDRIVSIEMFEHVGEIHHREYFEKVNNLLTENGIFVFQAHHMGPDYIVSYTPVLEMSLGMYCYFPRIEEVAIKSKDLLLIEDIQNLSFCCGLTMKAIVKKMRAKKLEYFGDDVKEYRKWLIYLCATEAMTLSGKDRLYQIVFVKNGIPYDFRH